MIHSENKQGFTLIEAILSTVIIGVTITALLSSQGVMLFSIEVLSNQYSRLLLAKNILYQTRLQGKKSTESTVDNPATTIKYSQEKASGTIGKQFKDLYKEKVVYEWTEGRNKRSDEIVSFIFNPKKKEEAQ